MTQIQPTEITTECVDASLENDSITGPLGVVRKR
jgi:hypothetical protein